MSVNGSGVAGGGGNRIGRRLRGFARDARGASAVEFALVALPFLGLAGASLESGVTYWAQETLQQAVSEAGRSIYTGRFQTGNAATKDKTNLLTAFRNEMCGTGANKRVTLFNCANVRISITQADTFTNATPVQPTAIDQATGKSDWNPSFDGYTCARSNAIVVVQAAVDVPVYFNMLASGQTSLPNRRRVLQAATVFQVEPFDSSAVCS